MTENTKSYLNKFSKRLNEATKDCRDDMHEPDEQEISAKVLGNHIDNAMGNDPDTNCGELTVGIIKDSKTEWFNLATLIDLARQAKIQ